MKIDSLIVASLGSLLGVGAVGCSSSCDLPANSPSEPIERSQELTLDDVEFFLSSLGFGLSELSPQTPCSEVCVAVFFEYGLSQVSLENCQYVMDGTYQRPSTEGELPGTTGAADDGGGMDWDGSKVVGSITCSGMVDVDGPSDQCE